MCVRRRARQLLSNKTSTIHCYLACFCGAKQKIIIAVQQKNVHPFKFQIMENITKLGPESKELKPPSLMPLCSDACVSRTGGLHFTATSRCRSGGRKINLNPATSRWSPKLRVFKLQKKRSNAFGLNVKQQQVLNTSMCPLAAIKPSREKKRERDEILSKSFSSQRVPELVPYVFYTGQNRAVWALLDSATWVTFENN